MRKTYITPIVDVMELDVERMMAFSIDTAASSNNDVSDNGEEVGARESVFDHDF